jgi:DnaJ-class molecular chaperone
MGQQRTYYQVLGVDPDCTAADIQAAYRALAKQFHPDRNQAEPEAMDRTQELNAAYQVLKDPERRQAYDAELAATQAQVGWGRAPAPIKQDVFVSVSELLHGAALTVTVEDPAHPDGPEHYALEVPAETAPGTRFKLTRTPPFERGVVEVRVKVRPDGRFRPRGTDLRYDLHVRSDVVARGGTEWIEGPDGDRVEVEIPARVPRGAILTVPELGLPDGRGGRGDLLVRVQYRPGVRVQRGGGSLRSRGWQRPLLEE